MDYFEKNFDNNGRAKRPQKGETNKATHNWKAVQETAQKGFSKPERQAHDHKQESGRCRPGVTAVSDSISGVLSPHASEVIPIRQAPDHKQESGRGRPGVTAVSDSTSGVSSPHASEVIPIRQAHDHKHA